MRKKHPAQKTKEKASPTETRGQFLAALEELVSHVEQSEPGFEFDHVQPLVDTLNATAQQMGYRMFGGISNGPTGDRIGRTEHHRVFMLHHPIDRDTFNIPVYSFDGPPVPSPWEMTDAEFCEAERRVEETAYRKLKFNEVNRHITTAEERGRILTCLRAWRRAVTSGEVAQSTTPIDIEELEEKTPALNKTDGTWVINKLAADLEGVKTRTLADYRADGYSNADKSFGVDKDGRIWRREGTDYSHPWYSRPSLRVRESKASKP